MTPAYSRTLERTWSNNLEQLSKWCRHDVAVPHGALFFEILRPLARRSIRNVPGRDYPADLLFMFAKVGIDHIINDDEPEVLAWFEDVAKPSSFHLRRPA